MVWSRETIIPMVGAVGFDLLVGVSLLVFSFASRAASRCWWVLVCLEEEEGEGEEVGEPKRQRLWTRLTVPMK